MYSIGIVLVISGGQTGIDQLALKVAKELGIRTAGTAPKGFITETGPAPWLADYGLKESTSSDYPPRTKQNIVDSDATLWLGNETSRGGLLTKSLCERLEKSFLPNPDTSLFVEWVNTHGIQILNVAGNRGSSLSPLEIEKYRQLLVDMLSVTMRIK